MRSRIALAALGLAFALLACEQVLGLDKLQKCDLPPCGDAASDADIDGNAGDAGDAAASDAFTLPDGVSEASSWARWPMDNTPAEIQGGAPDASLARFDASTPLFFDAVNGNEWCTQQIGKANNVTDAATACAKIGCRLPTRIEIVTLLDSTQQSAPYITPAFVPFIDDAGVSTLWTSSYVRPIVGTNVQFWLAELSTGDMLPANASNVGVLCIK